MKKLITKFSLLVALAISVASCEKSDLEHVDVPGTGATTIEIAKGAALSANGTSASSVVSLNYIVGEKLFPSKVIPKLVVYYLTNTQTGPTAVSSSVRNVLFTATNVSLTPTASPVAGAPVVTSIGAYGNSSNIVWGLSYTFNLGQLGTGLLEVRNGAVSTTRGTSIIIVAQDASNTTLAEYTITLSEYGMRTI